MKTRWIKKIASKLPPRAQQSLKKIHFAHQIRSGTFVTSEPEYARLKDWVCPGDRVIDLGANVGHYTARLSELVGATGRVFAFEPVPETFELLTVNMAVIGATNVTLFNAAASAQRGTAKIALPRFDSGLTNYYMAGITSSESDLSITTVPLDGIIPPARITLIKIDVEGHEYPALLGMAELLHRDHPRLIVEGDSAEVSQYLTNLGYTFTKYSRSPNRVFSISV